MLVGGVDGGIDGELLGTDDRLLGGNDGNTMGSDDVYDDEFDDGTVLNISVDRAGGVDDSD